MPRYDFKCENSGNGKGNVRTRPGVDGTNKQEVRGASHGPDGVFEREFSFAEVPERTACPVCGSEAKRILFYRFTVYGTDRFSDKAFADASEATGQKITNTKQIDALEASGEIRAITNPSRHRKFKEKK